MPDPTLDELRRYAVARTLFPPTTLARAIAKLGFVQVDPIRAPARAQDLTLRHRVKGYRAGDLERRYPELDLEEGFFVNYGYLRRRDYLRMHPRVRALPRAVSSAWSPATHRRAQAMLAFIREQGSAHPRQIEARFAHGKATNYWGGKSNATTHLLGGMHYRGLLRVARREAGVRVYAAADPAVAPKSRAERLARIDALVDLIVGKYAPLPGRSLSDLVGRLRWGTPQWRDELRPALARAKARLASARVDGIDWYWPANERPASPKHRPPDLVRLLSPFDPLVWDRRRFELLWGWAYRFEAYTKQEHRKLGYYALPLLFRERVVGWANVTAEDGDLRCQLGFATGRPADPVFERELAAELDRLRAFLRMPALLTSTP